MASYPNSLNPISFDESSLNTPILAAFADSHERTDDDEAEDEFELHGTLSDNGDGTFDLETRDGTVTILTNDNTIFDENLSLSELDGFEVDVEGIETENGKLATEIEFDDDERTDDDESDAIKAIEDAEEEIAKANEKIAEAADKGKNTEFSEEKLTDARDLLADAEASFADGNFEDAEELAEEAKDLAAESRMKYLGKSLDDDKKKTKQEKLAEKQAKKDAKLAEKQARTTEKLAERENKLSEKAKFSEERANKIIEKLEKRIQEMEERIQKLIDKYHSGKYFGNLKNADAITKSFTISLDGFASEINDSSNVESFTGNLYLENQVTGNNAKKFRVTGGELFIGDIEVYDVVFGKARLSSSGSGGDKDSMIIITQTSNGVDVRTLKLNIDLSESLGSDTESIDLEILSPRSKIANEWFLGGTGTMNTTESMESVDTLDSDESDVSKVIIPDVDIPITSTISVSTPTNVYFLGDEIIISGTVTDIFEGTPVILQTVTSSDMIDIAQIEIGPDGVFTHSITADGPLWVSAIYTVKAFYGANNVEETTFEFLAE